MRKVWSDLCKLIGNGFPFPPNFTDARLVLLPKKDKAVFPHETRPISITNSSYRIIMKIWAKPFRSFASRFLPPSQRALLEGRFIDDCIDNISNWYKALANGNQNPFILQTDFKKAFDFLNRDAILDIFTSISLPPKLLNIARFALNPSTLTIFNNGTAPYYISSVTGVKQGCPLSPLIFIMAFDLLLFHLNKIPAIHLVRGYMDDIALISTSPEAITEAATTINLFCHATGAELNFNKCFIISPTIPSSPLLLWEDAIYQSETTYLGIHLSHLDDDFPIWNHRISKILSACLRIKSSPSTSISNKIN